MKVAGRQVARKRMVRRQADEMKKTRMQGDTRIVARKIGGHDSDGESCRWPHVLARIIIHGHDASGQEFSWIECKSMQDDCTEAEMHECSPRRINLHRYRLEAVHVTAPQRTVRLLYNPPLQRYSFRIIIFWQ